MKASETEKRRGVWLNFAIAGAVVVGLSLSISQMVPKSHPIRALRHLDERKAQEAKPIQGAPFGAVEATVQNPTSADMKPDLTADSPPPNRAGGELADWDGTYQSLTFETLTDYRIREPNWTEMDDPAYIATLNLEEQIPAQIRAMDGKKIEIQGFMLPLELSDDTLRTFMLLENQMACCFGAIPRLNQWVYVTIPEQKKVKANQDVLVTLFGTLRVGPEFDQEMLTGIYHLDLERVKVAERKLSEF